MTGNWLRLLGPKIKPALFPYWLWSRGITLGVRCAALDENGQVCLVKHTYTPGWHLPGGGVEPGETALQALEKELIEEAGITLIEQPNLFAVYANQNASSRDHVIVFTAKNWTQRNIDLPTTEIAEVGMFNPARLPSDTSPGTCARLGEIINGHTVRPIW